MSWIERRLPHFGVKPRRVCYLTIFCVLKLLLLSQLVSSSFQSQLPDALFLLYSPGGGGFTARRCTPPAAARQVAPSCPEQLAESEAGESRAAADGNGWSDRGLLRVHLRPATEHGTSLFPRLSLLILYGQTSLFSPSVVGSSSGRLFAFNSRLYSTTCWLCSLQTPAPAVCDSQVWKLCQRACMCAVQTEALRSALT